MLSNWFVLNVTPYYRVYVLDRLEQNWYLINIGPIMWSDMCDPIVQIHVLDSFIAKPDSFCLNFLTVYLYLGYDYVL